MKYMGLNEIREKYLSFFESKGHLRLPSFPLVPQNDKSILLINAGMTPLKPYFTGEQTPPRNRVTTCQKCIRTPDIDNVGKTARHGTFFEMLGNFSFGDYFKKEVIPWAWEFCTEVMQLPKERLYVTVYLDDDEAYDIWKNDIGVDPSHISRMGKEDNFWEHGQGPCGPCSEIYFDRGEEKGCGRPDCRVGCECDRYVEFWNLVFTQFDNDGKGNYTKLDHCNIDTGMGLERLACIMQQVDSLFDVDTIKNITAEISALSGKKYGQSHETDVSLRVVTDHIRSTVFMVGDGILPSNEGRGYVLRRLLRRAARHGKLLGITAEHFLCDLAEVVIRESGGAYPELQEKKEYIKTIIEQEENRFNQTIDSGLVILSEMMDQAKKAGETKISGSDAFRLYDTFGFPLDLTLEILRENGLETDENAFHECMQEQKTRARNARQASDSSAWKGDEAVAGLPKTVFEGYMALEGSGTVLRVIGGENTTVITDKTVFYGESGGQAGDCGTLIADGVEYRVTGCKKKNGVFLHIIAGEADISEGCEVFLKVCRDCREATMRNHSSAHLLQAALKKVLGGHIAQAGSYVDRERMRFDFSHFAPLTEDELKTVEDEVNRAVFAGLPVVSEEMPLEEAKNTGATALFGEKYGDTVRVVSMGDFSVEFCGGTHVENTAGIGLFKIVSETGVAAGVRRIEAVTGENMLALFREKEALLKTVCGILKTPEKEAAARAESLTAELKQAYKSIAELNEKMSASQIDAILGQQKKIGALTFICGQIDAKTDILRGLCDKIKAENPLAVAVLFGVSDGKVAIAASCGKEAVSAGANAGMIVKKAAGVCLGGGGGRPDSATAGGKDATKIPEAMAAAEDLIKNL